LESKDLSNPILINYAESEYPHKNAVRTSQETHYVSATKPNRLMQFRETVAVYCCENHTEHTDTLCGQNAVRTSEETYYISATEPNRLMMFRETVAVYCENYKGHTDTRTLFGQNTVRTSQETHYVSATEPNRLLMFRETVAVYCENHTDHIDTLTVLLLALVSVAEKLVYFLVAVT
jgi:thioredoxin-related protein